MYILKRTLAITSHNISTSLPSGKHNHIRGILQSHEATTSTQLSIHMQTSTERTNERSDGHPGGPDGLFCNRRVLLSGI